MFPKTALKGVMMNHNTPGWSGPMLRIAAVYNILWGSFIVLFPSLPFQWAGMTVPNYPCLCQCIGMIVGVYGVGYWIAAGNPVRHWPIVLVGLLGKIFGPIGFVWCASRGELPWIAGLTILTNDLAWWIPFGITLLTAWKIERESQPADSTLLVAR